MLNYRDVLPNERLGQRLVDLERSLVVDVAFIVGRGEPIHGENKKRKERSGPSRVLRWARNTFLAIGLIVLTATGTA